MRPVWNAVMPDLFGWKKITVTQAFSLVGIAMIFVILGILTVWTTRLMCDLPIQ
jgi:hypothetical protein